MKKMKTRDRTRYKLFLKGLIEQKTVNRDEIIRLNEVYQKAFGRPPHKPFTSCGSCIKDRAMKTLDAILTPEEKEKARQRRIENRRRINELKNKRKS